VKLILFLKNFFCALIIGKIVFFGAVLAPKVFKVLERKDAALLQNSIFPNYYKIEIIAFSGLCLCLFLLKNKLFKKIPSWTLSSLGLALVLYSLISLTPQIAELSHAGLGQSEAFQDLHSTSKAINSLCLLIALVLLWI